MLRRSEDIFLDALDDAESAIIKKALDKIDHGNCDEAREILKPLLDVQNKAALFYNSSFSVSGESLEDFEKRRISQLEQSASFGYPPAIHDLAVHYDAGELLPRDVKKAAKLFGQAAELGHPHSQWIHGLDLIYGRNGIDKNERLGVDYIEKSAIAKFEGALESMSEFYEKGKYGFPINPEKAQGFRKQINDEDILGY